MKGFATTTLLLLLVALLVGGFIGYKMNKPTTQKAETAQKMTKEPAKGSKEWKIQNAKSAAPASISRDATILDWPAKEGEEMPLLVKGKNDWTCLPDTPMSPDNDPVCADKTAVEWFQAYMTQQEPDLQQDGLAYMLQGGSDGSNTDPFAMKPAKGEKWIKAPAHIMVLPSGELDPEVYGTNPDSGKPWIMWAGTPYQHLMVPVK